MTAAGLGSYSQNTAGGGVFGGYDFYPQHQFPIRAEIEYAIRSNMNTTYKSAIQDDGMYAETKAEWNVQTLFANFYYDFHNSSAFTPYIGAGLGLGFINNSYETRGMTPLGAILSGPVSQRRILFSLGMLDLATMKFSLVG